MTNRRISLKTLALGSCAVSALIAGPAAAEQFSVQAQDLRPALQQFATQGDQQVLFSSAAVAGKRTAGFSGEASPEAALQVLLAGTDLVWSKTAEGALLVKTRQEAASDPQSGSAAGDGADGTVQALIVTAQKKEEQIQDVPIAISAFTEKSLEEQKIEGGFDLLKAIPNVTFSKNNFTSYNFSIRGVGTKAVSATTDPGVAVSFNNIAVIQNRLFEQEYFDVERVEVLRGPQGTLYGRNATAGVINVISAKANLHQFDGWVKGEVGNYHSKRLSAMINIPLVEDKLAIRIAGSLTDRQGYDYNSVTKHAVNGRDLWSGRITVGFNPTERLRSNLIWERFNEDDNRSRTGKQLCYRDPGPSKIGNTSIAGSHPEDIGNPYSETMRPALFSQGCRPGSLYGDQAFGTPNGLALPFVFAMLAVGVDCGPGCSGGSYSLGVDQNGKFRVLVDLKDPYGGLMQSRDLRTIASFNDPIYRAKNDTVEFNFDYDVTDQLLFSSQTAYVRDQVYSFQDYNRFNTQPIFTDTSTLVDSPWETLAPGGIFCDPQLGCSNTLAGFDISKAKGAQFSQELRLQSSFDGSVNFSVGANYTRFKTLVDYYVLYNLITGYAESPPFYYPADGKIDITKCFASGMFFSGPPVPAGDPAAVCPYIDPNPLESMNGEGHNYFRSKNPYKLSSAAVFGEFYWQASSRTKVTAGLRYTDDRKTFIPVPSQILMAPGILAGGYVSKGYPEEPAIKQHWGEFTGRLGVDYKPDLPFTDQTMIYGFYSRGYKGGGANPPQPGFGSTEKLIQYGAITPQQAIDFSIFFPLLELTAVDYGPTFKPEFVNAFEVGSKNTLMGGALTLNGDVFFYDYKDYQVSQIRDRTAVNENFDAKVWGAELETFFTPSPNLRFNFNLGYLDTRIADGAASIDIMNRTQSDPNYTLAKPWSQLPSNCVVPTPVAEAYLQNNPYVQQFWDLCGGAGGLVGAFDVPQWDPTLQKNFDFADYPELNGGAGLKAQLGGNELPNSPHWTSNVGAQYGLEFADGWRATVRGDAYWQSQSWARVYNAVNDKLHGWYNVNLSLWIERPEEGLKIELYAKNLLDKTPITDAFLNSDDTALTTNVFVLDPRLLGLSIKKDF